MAASPGLTVIDVVILEGYIWTVWADALYSHSSPPSEPGKVNKHMT